MSTCDECGKLLTPDNNWIDEETGAKFHNECHAKLADEKLCRTAIAHYGEPAQVLKAIEEMAELSFELSCHFETNSFPEQIVFNEIRSNLDYITKACKEYIDISNVELDKDYNNCNTRFECADVENMLNQLRIMFGTWDAEKKMKNERLMERIKNEQANNG